MRARYRKLIRKKIQIEYFFAGFLYSIKNIEADVVRSSLIIINGKSCGWGQSRVKEFPDSLLFFFVFFLIQTNKQTKKRFLFFFFFSKNCYVFLFIYIYMAYTKNTFLVLF